VESYIQTTEELLSKIEKTNPDVVVMDLDLYAKIDGIETSRRIRSQFDVPVMYVWIRVLIWYHRFWNGSKNDDILQ